MSNHLLGKTLRHSLAALVILVSSAHSGIVVAASASHQAKAAELLELTNIKRQLDVISRNLLTPVKQRLSMVRTSPDRAQLIREHIAAVEALVSRELSWDSTKSDYLALYTSTYTEDELTAIVDFFKSPPGQKYLADKPEFNQGIAKITTTRMEKIKPDLIKMEQQLKERLETLRAADTEAKP